VAQDRVEQRRQRGADLALRQRRPAVQAGGEDDREVELLFGRAELVEELEGRVDHVVGTRARAVDLVDDDDGLEASASAFLVTKRVCGIGPIDRIDRSSTESNHRQHALDLAAEIGVARGVDDVDVRALPLDRAVLRQDRDAAFLFEVVVVHHALATFSFSRKVPL